MNCCVLRKVPNTKIFRYICVRKDESPETANFNISQKVTNIIALLVASRAYVNIQAQNDFVTK
jgi:hypothetical protein